MADLEKDLLSVDKIVEKSGNVIFEAADPMIKINGKHMPNTKGW